MTLFFFLESLLDSSGFYKSRDINFSIPVGNTVIRAGLALYLLDSLMVNDGPICIRKKITNLAHRINEAHNKDEEFLWPEDAYKRDMTEAFEKLVVQMEKYPFDEETIFKLSSLNTHNRITIEGLLFHPVGINTKCIDDEDALASLRTNDVHLFLSTDNNRACIKYIGKQEKFFGEDYISIESMELTDYAKAAPLTLHISYYNPDLKPNGVTKAWNEFPYAQRLQLTAGSNKEVVCRSLLYMFSVIRHYNDEPLILEKMKVFGEYSESDWMRILQGNGIVF